MAKMTIKTNFHDNLAPFRKRKEAKLLNAKVAKCQREVGQGGGEWEGDSVWRNRKQGLYEPHTQAHTLAGALRKGRRGNVWQLGNLQTSFKWMSRASVRCVLPQGTPAPIPSGWTIFWPVSCKRECVRVCVCVLLCCQAWQCRGSSSSGATCQLRLWFM